MQVRVALLSAFYVQEDMVDAITFIVALALVHSLASGGEDGSGRLVAHSVLGVGPSHHMKVRESDVAKGLALLRECPSWDVLDGYSLNPKSSQAKLKFAKVELAMAQLCKYDTATLRETVRVLLARETPGTAERHRYLQRLGLSKDSDDDARVRSLTEQLAADGEKVVLLDRFAFNCPEWDAIGAPALPGAPVKKGDYVNVLWPLEFDARTSEFALIGFPPFTGNYPGPLSVFDEFRRRYSRRRWPKAPANATSFRALGLPPSRKTF